MTQIDTKDIDIEQVNQLSESAVENADTVNHEQETERLAMEYHLKKDSGNWLAVKQICEQSRNTDVMSPRLIDYLETEVFSTVIEYKEVDVNNLYRAIQYRDVDGNMFTFTGPEMLHMLDNFHIPVPKTSGWPMSVIKNILFRHTPEDKCAIELFVYTDEVVVCIGDEWMNAADTESCYCTVIPRHPDVDIHRYI